MRSFLLTWNPTRLGSWKRFKADVDRFDRKGSLALNWSCGSRRDLPTGSRVFLMRLGGSDPGAKGLIARGVVTVEPYAGEHWSSDRDGDSALYIGVRLDSLDVVPRITLKDLQRLAPAFEWTPRGAGVQIPADVASVLEREWESVPAFARDLPEELSPQEALIEGSSKTIRVNAWERNRHARVACLKHHGTRCVACGLDLESLYGPIARGFAHVHHVVPLAEVGKQYVVNPITDLVPVCPTCHAVIHLAKPPLTIEALRDRIERRGPAGVGTPSRRKRAARSSTGSARRDAGDGRGGT